ncbi:hypothetical protein ACET3Z_012300 [Daucus carota]
MNCIADIDPKKETLKSKHECCKDTEVYTIQAMPMTYVCDIDHQPISRLQVLIVSKRVCSFGELANIRIRVDSKRNVNVIYPVEVEEAPLLPSSPLNSSDQQAGVYNPSNAYDSPL